MKTLLLSLLVVFVIVRSNASENFKNVFYDRLDMLLDYCIANPETLDSGTVLGVLFAKGQLERHPKRQNVVQLIRKSVKLENQFLKKQQKPTISNEIVHELIMDPSVLRLHVGIKNLQHDDRNFDFATLNRYIRLVNDERNLPNGVSSDKCLFEVFNGCQVSQECFVIEDPRASSFGYSQTHKLLFHLFNFAKCGNKNFMKFSNHLCTEVLHESSFIVDKLSELPELKDLLMEQLFVCTIAGFREFFNDNWISKMLTWQQTSGCFSYDSFNCSSHMNGLAAANLAILGTTLDAECI